MSEKSVNISLTRIFNYPEENSPPQLTISFYSKKTQSLIIKKTTKSTSINNCLNLSVNLRINYTEQENAIIIVVEEAKPNLEEMKLIGQAEICLDELQEKKVKYYTIGKEDKILQVQVYDSKKRKRPEQSHVNGENVNSAEHREKFLSERRKFLENIIQTESQLKRNFSQKIMELINDSKSLRQQKGLQEQRKEQKNLIYDNQLEDYSEEKLKKSRSDQALNAFYGRNYFTSGEHKERRDSKQKSIPSQKHKLMLNTLNLVETEHQSKGLFRDRY